MYSYTVKWVQKGHKNPRLSQINLSGNCKEFAIRYMCGTTKELTNVKS